MSCSASCCASADYCSVRGSRLDHYIVAVTENERPLQRRLAQALRAQGKSVSYSFGTSGVGKQFKDADARGAAAVIVLGPTEVAEGLSS